MLFTQVATTKEFANVLPLAISQFRKDWPFMALRLDGMRSKATPGGPACGVSASAAGASAFVQSIPYGNHGDNNLSHRTVSK